MISTESVMASKISYQPEALLWPVSGLIKKISADEVHVWAWSFAGSGEPAGRDLGILNDYERQRVARYRFPPDQIRYAVCHANMRRILGSYLLLAPESLNFLEGSGGKPHLADQAPGNSLCFNLSHSKGTALLAVSLGRELGVDVEDLRPIEPAVAERFFSPAEVTRLSTLSGHEWLKAFYRCWTRKESILKAEGAGLRIPLDSFDVSLLAEERAALLAARPESKLTKAWRLHHLAPAEEVMGALAVAEASIELRLYSLLQEAE